MATPYTAGPDRLKQHLTRVAMLFVLAGSLLWAYSISSKQTPPTVQITSIRPMGLSIRLPGQWTSPSEPLSITGANSASSYISRPIADHVITIAKLNDTSLRSPSVALDSAVLHWLGDTALEAGNRTSNTVVAVTAGALTGRIYGAIQPTADGLMIHVLCVVTIDGHDYRLIAYQHMTPNTPNLKNQLTQATQMTRDIVAQMEGQLTRSPSEHVYRMAGMTGWRPHEHIETVTLADQPVYRVPLLIPTERAGQLHIWRVRISPDITDPSLGLDPMQLIASQFLHATGRAPRTGEIWAGTVLGQDVWRIGHVLAQQGLVRQFIFMRLPHARGVLLELIAEPGVLPLTAQWLEVLARQAAGLLPVKSNIVAKPEQMLKQAVGRGAEIVHQQNTEVLRRLTPGWNFTIIETDGKPIGCQVTEVKETDGADTQIRGRTLTLLFKPEHVRIIRGWQISKDGKHWICQTMQRIGSSETPDLTEAHLRLGTDGSTFSMIVGDNNQPNFTIDTPPGLVGHPIEEYWPTGANGISSTDPALIWMTHGISHPRPYWVGLAPLTNDSPSVQSKQPSHTMLIRSALAMDPDIASLDESGQIIRQISKRMTSLLPGVIITSRSVDRAELMRMFPAMEGLLGSWEREGITEHADR